MRLGVLGYAIILLLGLAIDAATSLAQARPVIVARPGDSATFASDAKPQTSASGKLTVSHSDRGESVSLKVTKIAISGPSGVLTERQLLGFFRVKATAPEDPDEPNRVDDLDEVHNITWTFRSGSESFSFLSAEERLALRYTITATDADNLSANMVVTITLRGRNRPPTTIADSAIAGEITELPMTSGSDAPNFVFGTIRFRDVNLGDRHTVSVSLGRDAVHWSESGAIPQASLAALVAALGAKVRTDSTGTGDGVIDWRFEVSDRLLDFVAAREAITIAYDVVIEDSAGGKVTAPLNIKVTGSNDGPIARDDWIEVNDSESVTANPLANDRDPDLNDTTFFVLKKCTSLTTNSSGEPTADKSPTVVGAYGHLKLQRKGSVTYTRHTGSLTIPGVATGEDRFVCNMDDQHGGPESQARLVFSVTGRVRLHTVTFDEGRGIPTRADPANPNSAITTWEEDGLIVVKERGSGLALVPDAQGRALSMGIPGTGALASTTYKASVCRKDRGAFDFNSAWLSKPDGGDFIMAGEFVVGLFDAVGRPPVAVIQFGKRLECFTIEQRQGLPGTMHMRVDNIAVSY